MPNEVFHVADSDNYVDLEKQGDTANCDSVRDSINEDGAVPVVVGVGVIVSDGEPVGLGDNESVEKPLKNFEPGEEELTIVVSPKEDCLSRNASSHEQCRICQAEKEEVLIDLGCKCRGGLAKAHRSCIDTWFSTRQSNKCEICQNVAANVSPPEPQLTTNFLVWRIDTRFRSPDRERGCFSPLWVAFSILIGGLLLDVLISVTLGVSALPVNIIIGVIVVLGLGTALRLTLEFCYDWRSRRVVETDVHLGYHPAL